MNNKLKTGNQTQIDNNRTTISISKDNYLILKKMGYTSMSMNDVLTKILEKQSGVYRVDV